MSTSTPQQDTYVYRVGDKLYINLTNKCCNACAFCIRTYSDGVGEGEYLWLRREPTADEVIGLIEAVDYEFFEAVFCGYGEPTYKPHELRKIGEYLKSKGKRVRLNTNGLGNLINGRDIVQDLVGAVDIVSVSLNESDEVKYDALCKSEYGIDAYPAILEFTKRCAAAGLKTVMTVVDAPGLDIAQCEKRAAAVGAELRVRQKIAQK